MPRVRRIRPPAAILHTAYLITGSIQGVAEQYGVSFPTAWTWLKAAKVPLKRPGYTPPQLSFTGLQCRHARECLGFTREAFCREAKVSKTTLRQFELGRTMLRHATQVKVLALFNRNNVMFKSDGTFQFWTDKEGLYLL